MTTKTTFATDQLAALVERKLHVLSLLKRLAEQQLVLIEAGDMGLLVKLLAAKQTLLVQIQELEGLLDPFRAQDPEERIWRSPEVRTHCQQQADRCGQLLAELMQLEKQGEGQMIRRRDQAAVRLQTVHSAAEASAAYAASPLHFASGLEASAEG